MAGQAAAELGQLQISVSERLGRQAADYAERKLRGLARYASEPVLHARVRLTLHPDPALARPVVAQGNLDVNGRPVRVQVAAATAVQATDLLHDVLRARLARVARHWEAVRGARPVLARGEWRHASEPAHRPDHFPRPAAERQVVRHKSFELPRCTVAEAAESLDRLGYDFHLFTEVGSGQDSVLYRTPLGLRLAQVHPAPRRVRRGEVPFSVSRQPAAVLSRDEAVRRLDLSGQPFLFYAEPAAGERGGRRGWLLYRRYDGHYGLVTPAG